jgi:TATA-binding protein-associated factor
MSLTYFDQDGINWLMFLKRYNLSCILADDMGLGKVRFMLLSAVDRQLDFVFLLRHCKRFVFLLPTLLNDDVT